MTLVVLLLLAAVLVWPAAPVDGRSEGPGPPVAPRRPAIRWPWRRRDGSGPAWVADLAEVTAVGLRAGLDLPSAVRVAARSPVVACAVPTLAGAADRSVDVAALVDGLTDDACTDPGARRDLAVLARAWRLSATTGAAAASTTAAAASAVRARTAARHRTAAALAGPRASMRLLTALPLCGPVVGLLVGLDPAALYGSRAATTAAAAGVTLTGLGWLWATTLLRRAARPTTTGTSG